MGFSRTKPIPPHVEEVQHFVATPLEFQAFLGSISSGTPNFYKFSNITPMEFRLFLNDFCIYPYEIPLRFKPYPAGVKTDFLNRDVFFWKIPLMSEITNQ